MNIYQGARSIINKAYMFKTTAIKDDIVVHHKQVSNAIEVANAHGEGAKLLTKRYKLLLNS